MQIRDEHDADIKQEDLKRLLVETVMRYQVLYRHWVGQYTGDRELLRLELNDCVVSLWLILKGAMHKLAARWISRRTVLRRRYGRIFTDDHDVETLAWNFFLAMIERLPSLAIDPERNVQALLAKVAWFAIYDQHKKEHPASEMAFYSLEQPVGADSDQLLGDTVADPATIEQYDNIVLQLEFQACRMEVLHFWQSTLGEDDKFIMSVRWSEEPQPSFAEIAQRMSAGWTTDAVRQRHHRTLIKTKQHLRELGWEPFS